MACGGELYVRGYVRAIAGAVGIDALPLIREFDQAQLGGGERDVPAPVDAAGLPGPDATRFDLHAVTDFGAAGQVADPDATRFDLPVVPAFDPPADPDATRFDLPVVPALPPATAPFDTAVPFDGGVPGDAIVPFGGVPSGAMPPAVFPPAAYPRDAADTRFDLRPVTDDLMAAGYQLPASQTQAWPGPPWPSAAPPSQGPRPGFSSAQGSGGRGSRQRTVAYTAVAAVAAVALIALAVRLAGGTATHSAAAATPTQRAAAPGSSGSASASAAAKASAEAAASAAAKASKSAAAKTAARVAFLPIAAARAFGPDGFADGDNPGSAGYTIAANPAAIWSTQWYATPDFGLLKHGTGLLLDLGSQMTVTGVRFDLTQYRGASLQIKVGNAAAPQNLRIAASAQGAVGVVRIALPHPEVARYLVVWFTLLAPDGAGHYQESVSHVAIAGHR
jgi:hypothetical protein